MSTTDLILFRTWPRLREHLPRHPLIDAPTPVEPLVLDNVPAGRLFVKRDDRSCELYGGNKPRKLEFVLGRALARGAKRIITTGALGSHHALATTILGSAAGLRTTLVLVPQPLTDEVEKTLDLDTAFGAEVFHARGVVSAGITTARQLVLAYARGESPYLISTGGSSALGNLGFVSAGLELAEQVRRGALPHPAEVYVPIGTGGTAAGLVLGFRLIGFETRVRGILVTDILPPSPDRLARSANASLRLLRRLAPEVPDIALGPHDFEIDASELGPGYGAVTPGAREACAAAAERGLALDMTYTAKCLSAILARAGHGELPSEPVLFWNTHNSVKILAPVGAEARVRQVAGTPVTSDSTPEPALS